MSELTTPVKDFIKFQIGCPESIPLNKEVSFNKVKFKYADLASLMKVVKPIANKNNFAIYHRIDIDSVTAILSHTSGEEFISRVELRQGLQAKDKGAEITYCKRYSLSALCGIVTEDDSDAQPMEAKPLPPLNKKAYYKAIDKIMNGEADVLKKCLLHFELTPQQKEELLNLDLEYNG